MGTLYVVATPIGNLEDMSPRVRRILGEAAVIACEDTRTSGLLMAGIPHVGHLVSYHKFNEAGRAGELVDRLLAGEDVAVISDAGTPCISDPGFYLVREARAAGVPVVGVSGPCAAVTALSVSGFDLQSFAFYGFPPRSGGDRRDFFARVGADSQPVAVLYEAPGRVKKLVQDVGEAFPQCRLCLCRELTKLFETHYAGTPDEVLQQLEQDSYSDKGEYCMVVEKNFTPPAAQTQSAVGRLAELMVAEELSPKEAVARLTAAGVPRREAYAAAEALKGLFRG